ncbi:DUF1672 family protein [Bacillus sp. NTK071]|uniref:DUF1672 family protein n=1 Tax=Bacillus sp. NTK071 TaxID=2802175 RepID=UPI001A8D9D4D|nr:DUF1672 family protein [Bacillus sp. NTK071]MBN8209803.1 DUF1672 family protein [Bacillus sp. NTK071]
MTNTNDEPNKEKEQNEEKQISNESLEDQYFKSVQDYTAEEYSLPNGSETDKIAEEHKEEVHKAVKAYFKANYKTDVKVHNIVGAVGGASVSVESIGKPHFYSYAIIPVDKQKGEVDPSGVWSQEGQVETAIVSGLYAWIFNDKFKKLDQYLNEKVNEYPIVGIPEEANQNGVGNYHTTPYYKVVIYGGTVEEKLLKPYLENPDRSKEEWAKMLESESINPARVGTLIQLYMEEPDVEPNSEIFDQIVNDLSTMEGLPVGKYSFLLHDNTIDKTRGQNTKGNTLERAAPNYIVKE